MKLRVIDYRLVRAGDLIPHPDNWRDHPPAQREAYAAILDEIGFAGAILTRVMDDGRLQIIDGHMRSEYSPDEPLPCVVTDLTAEEAEKALVTFDPLAAMARANGDKLAALHARIAIEHEGLREQMRAYAREQGAALEEDEPPADPGAQIDRAEELQQIWQVERGQVWTVGRHRVMCGDSTDAADVARLCNQPVQGAFTSPPYAEQRKKQYGGIPADEYVEWWGSVQSNVRQVLKDDGSFFVNIKPHVEDVERSLYVFDLVIAMRRDWEWMFIDEFCWLRGGVPKQVIRHFKNQFEPVYQFAKSKNFKFRPDDVRHHSDDVPIPYGQGVGDTNWASKQGHVKNIFGSQDIEPGWAYPGNVLKGIHQTESFGHEATFPPGLPEFFIKAYSDEHDIWYEPFLGSGTTLVACEQTGRVGYGMEIEPAYVAVTLQRLTDMGLEAKLQ